MGKTQRIAIDLSREALEAMRARVESGEYADEGAVVEAAVRLLESDDVSRRMDYLRQRVQQSLADGRQPLAFDDVERRMTAFMQQRGKPGP
ncbi:ribbon-helix-helix domain-containing protein [Allorhizobium pseudoryzae]|uniref:ribbon-helix-helix domain-containing protein n=1 Tax=Allorhizobium pseudoryzae TaxID=379684 RepID=UPI003D043974